VKYYLVMVAAVFLCSTAAVMVKESVTPPALLAGERLLLATLLLAPLYFRAARRHRHVYRYAEARRVLLPGLLLALHYITWNLGIRQTLVANGSLIVNLVPIAMPFFLYYLANERVNRLEVAGTALAITGVALLMAADFAGDQRYLTGNLLCLGSMVVLTGYLALGRRNRDIPNFFLYLVPLYGAAGVFCTLFALLLREDFGPYSSREYLLVLALTLVPTIAGHGLINFCLRHLRGQVVSIFNLFQFVFAGTLAFFVFGELPEPVFYAAAALMAGGAAIAVLGQPGATLRSPFTIFRRR